MNFSSCMSFILSNSSCMVRKMMPGCCEVPLNCCQPMRQRISHSNIRDCMCLPASCGPVRKNSGIISIQHAVDQVLRCRLVHIFLGCVFVEDAVEGKGLVLDSFSLGHEGSFLYGIVFRWIEYSVVNSQLGLFQDSLSMLTSTSRRPL